MKQQTAVDWFMEQISYKDENGFFIIDTLEDVDSFYRKAKEMEKEQIIDSYIEGGRKGFNFFGDDYEEYYNETYIQSSE